MPNGHPPLSDNDCEVAVLNYLAAGVEERLSDRNGQRHEAGWEPRQNVVLGVLESRVLASDAGQNDEQNQERARAAAPEESLGVDFSAQPHDGTITLLVDAQFALYLEEYPTLAEQRRYVLPDNAPGGADTAQAQSGRHQRTQERIISIWRRHNVCVSDVPLSIPLDGSVVLEGPALDRAITQIVDGHFARTEAARPFSTRTRQVATSALTSEDSFRDAIRRQEDRAFRPTYPQVRVSGFCQRLPTGNFLTSVSLTNATLHPPTPFQDLAIYDCRIRIRATNGSRLLSQRFHLAPADYRYANASQIVGHGRGCVVVPQENGIASTTFPVFVQNKVQPRADHVPGLRWSDLANEPDAVLGPVEEAMGAFLAQWDAFLAQAPAAIAAASRVQRDQFNDELRRFRLGRRSLADARLQQAFQMANRVFAEVNTGKPYDSWRLFQLVFIVANLPALAARESTDAETQAELEYADVLWFPTGGGKTEAYLGLIVCALFYDRLRGKACGMTAWLKFPLRMLSVQQLSRVLRVLVAAERVREQSLGNTGGQPFLLGYYVGSGNTPNSLRRVSGWWPGITESHNLGREALDSHRLVTECPYCSEERIELRPDLNRVRLLHYCSNCNRELPLLISDEEVYRYMPSVMVGTVDKLAGAAFFGEFTQFHSGAKFRCPSHGYFTFGVQEKCLVGELCNLHEREYVAEPVWYDPAPALIIQDELHLVREELGAFDAHYEGLLAELQRQGPSARPSKIIAASATIEQYEDQLRQVYGRRPRSFPSPGFENNRSFYTEEVHEARRLYAGVSPHYRRKADVAAIIHSELLERLRSLQDLSSAAARAMLGLSLSDSELASLLFFYEVSLSYVNSKAHGDQIAEELSRLSEKFDSSDRDPISMSVLTGQVPVAELAQVINRVEQETLATPRSQRLQALVGTSVVSHGVDLERLNIMTVAGLPARVADYIQATSRSGRTHAGLVVTVFESFNRRERSTFTHFTSYHRFLDRMVEPVPVNKYAYFAATRTLPGIVMAILWSLARQEQLGGSRQGIHFSRHLSAWWNSHAAQLQPLILAALERTYRSCVNGVNDQLLEDELIERVMRRWETVELPQMRTFSADRTTQLFRERVLSSFRDIDTPVDFGALSNSDIAYEALMGTRATPGANDAAQ